MIKFDFKKNTVFNSRYKVFKNRYPILEISTYTPKLELKI